MSSKQKPKSSPGYVFNYISKDGLKTLLEYKYVSGEYSIGDRILTPYWNWFVTLIPMVSSSSTHSYQCFSNVDSCSKYDNSSRSNGKLYSTWSPSSPRHFVQSRATYLGLGLDMSIHHLLRDSGCCRWKTGAPHSNFWATGPAFRSWLRRHFNTLTFDLLRCKF